MIIEPNQIDTATFHSVLLGAVAPRPIALASTVDADGNVNLSPFSFFNAFSSKPPILIFSPNRRVRDNTTKHTYENAKAVPEVVINVVTYDIVQQMSLSSTEYGDGVNEFVKAGFQEASSTKVKPPRVAEAKVAFECKVQQIIELGEEGGAGNLIVCEVVLVHVSDDVVDDNGKLDPLRLDLVGRMGGNWYVNAGREAMFEVQKPIARKGIGVDCIPDHIRLSEILSGNDLGQLGNVEKLPSQSEVHEFSGEPEVSAILEYFDDESDRHAELQKLAKQYLFAGDVPGAWKVLLQA